MGVGPGDEVFCSTLTFVAAANAIVYQGGVPVFVDSDRATWNLDPGVLSRALRARAAVGAKSVQERVMLRKWSTLYSFASRS